MGKRGDKKRRKQRQRQTGALPSHGVRSMSLGPVTFTQTPGVLDVRTDMDSVQLDALREAMQAARGRLPDRVLAIRDEIADLLAPHHAFDAVFAVWQAHSALSPSTLAPYADGGIPATSELVAHIALDRDDPGPTRAPTEVEYAKGVDAVRVGKLAAELVQTLPIVFAMRETENADQLDTWTDVRMRYYAQKQMVRTWAYPDQEKGLLREVFGPFNQELGAAVGFTVAEGIKLCEALATLPTLRFHARVMESKRQRDEFNRQIDQAERTGIPSTEPLVQQLAGTPRRERERTLFHSFGLWAFFCAGQAVAYSASELADHAEVSTESAQGFLNVFSVNFGARADADAWQRDRLVAQGGEMQVMRARPILHDGDGRYLSCAADTALFGLRDMFTDALRKPNGQPLKRFTDHRARVVEERALAALNKALKPEWSHRGVKYEWNDETGMHREGEADGVMRVDSVVVLVEAKAGAMAPSARQADSRRLWSELKSTVRKASEQLTQAEDVLVRGAPKKVTTSERKPLALDLEGITRVVHVAVTLEDLSSVAPAAWLLQEVGLVPEARAAPWIAGIQDLELICDLTERPVQLLHYLQRRRRSNRQRIWAMDEMDLYMHFLQRGLYWADEDVAEVSMEVHNHTDELDKWWFGERGVTKRTKKPHQKFNRATRQLLDDLEETGIPSFIEAQLMILELPPEAQKQVSATLKTFGNKTKLDGESRGRTFVQGQDFGITLQTFPASTASTSARDRLLQVGKCRSEEHGLRRWLGMNATPGGSHRIMGISLILDSERLQDEEPDQKPLPAPTPEQA